jgi:hypothetical protein
MAGPAMAGMGRPTLFVRIAMRRPALHVVASGKALRKRIGAADRGDDEGHGGQRKCDGQQDLAGPALSAKPNDPAGDDAKLCHRELEYRRRSPRQSTVGRATEGHRLLRHAEMGQAPVGAAAPAGAKARA